MTAQSIYNYPNLYVDNLNIVRASTTTLTVAAGEARDSTNVSDLVLSTGVTVNGAVNGLNGLDTGSLAASTLYSIFVIGSSLNGIPISGSNFTSTPVGAIISADSTPLMPFGYDVYRRIGYIFTDGSSHFLDAYYAGNGKDRVVTYDTAIAVLTGGVATVATALDLSGAGIPATSGILVNFMASFTPATAGNTLIIRSHGLTGTNGCVVTGQVATKAMTLQVQVPALIGSSVAEVDYLVSNSSDAATIYVRGYVDNL